MAAVNSIRPVPPVRAVITPELVTGTCDTGDLLENVLDELRAILGAAERLYCDNHDGAVADLLYLAHRKADAAVKVYARNREDEAPESGSSLKREG